MSIISYNQGQICPGKEISRSGIVVNLVLLIGMIKSFSAMKASASLINVIMEVF